MIQPITFNLLTLKIAQDLSKSVNDHLAEDWRLFGKPFFGDGNLYQAVILKKESAKRLRMTTEDG